MKKNVVLTVLLSLIILSLSSCSSTKVLPANVSNNAKNLNLSKDKAIVYVFRTSALGFAVGLNVDCNNSQLASFYPKKFYVSVLDPGKYVFTGRAENESDLIVNLEANKKYYIEAIPQMGFGSARIKLKQIDQIDGNSKVQKCKLIGLNDEAKELLNYE
ncbi:MAG: DUF2846 domain-containing protein [Anditalea sp.]